MDNGNFYCKVLYYNTITWWICDDGEILELNEFPDIVYDEFSHEDK